MSPQIKYAYKTHNTWVYRRTYPKALQPLLGSALKQSLKTGDATQAKTRVAELNQTYTNIIFEAEGQVKVHRGTDADETAAILTLAVAVPRYQRVRLLGQRSINELATEYLADVSSRLRPGSYKSVRFALELLSSHLGTKQVGDITLELGKQVLGHVANLSPNIRKYHQAKGASLSQLAVLSQELEGTCLTPQTQARIMTQMQQFLE